MTPSGRVGAARDVAVFGEGMYIKGEVKSGQELYIAGQLDGTLDLQHALTVGPNAKIKANIKAKDLTVHGSVHGSVEVAGKIVIHENGSLIGDIKTAGIVIDDGAYFKGSIDIVRPPKNAGLPEPPPTSESKKGD